MSAVISPKALRPAAQAPFDLQRIRKDFPILELTVHGKPLAYLDNAASAQMPRQVLDRLIRYQTREHANVHRAVHTLSEAATAAYEGARARVQRFINAREERVACIGRAIANRPLELSRSLFRSYVLNLLQVLRYCTPLRLLSSWTDPINELLPRILLAASTGNESTRWIVESYRIRRSIGIEGRAV